MTSHDIFLFGISSLIGLAVGYALGRLASRRIGGTGGVGGIGGTGGPGGGTGGQGGVGGQGGAPDRSGTRGGAGSVGEGGGEPGSDAPASPSMRTGWHEGPIRVFGVAILVLAVMSVAIFYQANSALRSVTACQTERNNEFRAALAARASVSRGQNAAMHALIVTSADPHATADVRRNAVQNYLAALDSLDKVQADNPLVNKPC